MNKYKNHNSYEMGNKINSYFISNGGESKARLPRLFPKEGGEV